MQNRRSHFQQQPDFHITSQTFLASTLHITRLNMRNPSPVTAELSPGGGPRAEIEAAVARDGGTEFSGGEEVAGNGNPDRLGNPLQIGGQPDIRPSENGGANPGAMNPFSSLLLWILGGASSESLNSFLSIFRDVREHGQVYAAAAAAAGGGNPRQENRASQTAE